MIINLLTSNNKNNNKNSPLKNLEPNHLIIKGVSNKKVPKPNSKIVLSKTNFIAVKVIMKIRPVILLSKMNKILIKDFLIKSK